MNPETSEPLPLRVDVAILGAGFGGLCMGIQLQRAGLDNFVILEKGTEVGGTWRDNQYPGAACDVQSHLYSYSFAPKPDWPLRYSGWRDIQQYTLDVTDRFDLRKHIRLGQEVVSAQLVESSGLWTITTAQGLVVICQFWVLASGPLHVPAVPDFAGLSSFRGKVMHSARWDKDYDLRGKRVASIGSGGSAIQYVPEVAKQASHLYVFQRTAAWVIPRDTRSYSTWRKKLFARVPLLRVLHRWQLYWTNESRVWPLFAPGLAKRLQKAVEWNMRRQVKDKALADKLIPNYTIGCKRILISNAWLPTFNRANVQLVSESIREIRPHSIVTTDGQEHAVDCIVLGTGFVVDPRLYMQGFTLTGRGDHTLGKDWAKTITSYLGITTAGYPNMFQLVGPHTALGHNSIIFMIEAQVHYILQCMHEVRRRGAQSIEVKPEAQQGFLQWVTRKLKGTVWSSGCRGWYQSADGVNFTIWPASTWRYWLRTRRVNTQHYTFTGTP